MNILLLNLDNNTIINTINYNNDVCFMSTHLFGTKNHISKKLKLVIDIKYRKNINYYNIDSDNNLVLLFNRKMNLEKLNIIINLFFIIKNYLINHSFLKEDYVKFLICVNEFYKLLNYKEKDIQQKMEMIISVIYYKYMLSYYHKKKVNYNYKLFTQQYKNIITQNYKSVNYYNLNLKETFLLKTIVNKKDIDKGVYSTLCFCITDFIEKIQDINYKNYLMKKLYTYEKKYINI